MNKNKYLIPIVILLLISLCSLLPSLVFGQVLLNNRDTNMSNQYSRPDYDSLYKEADKEAYPWNLYDGDEKMLFGDYETDVEEDKFISYIYDFVGMMQNDTILSSSSIEENIIIDTQNNIVFIKDTEFISQSGNVYNASIAIADSCFLSYRSNSDNLISHEEYMEAFEYIDSQCKLAMQLYAEGRGVTGPLGELFEKVYKYTDINMLYYLLESYYSIKYSENYLVVEFLSKMNVDGNDSLATVARLYYDTEEQSFTGFDLYTSE